MASAALRDAQVVLSTCRRVRQADIACSLPITLQAPTIAVLCAAGADAMNAVSEPSGAGTPARTHEHRPHAHEVQLMHLPGGATYMDAHTYQQLVWADLGGATGGNSDAVLDDASPRSGGSEGG